MKRGGRPKGSPNDVVILRALLHKPLSRKELMETCGLKQRCVHDRCLSLRSRGLVSWRWKTHIPLIRITDDGRAFLDATGT